MPEMPDAPLLDPGSFAKLDVRGEGSVPLCAVQLSIVGSVFVGRGSACQAVREMQALVAGRRQQLEQAQQRFQGAMSRIVEGSPDSSSCHYQSNSSGSVIEGVSPMNYNYTFHSSAACSQARGVLQEMESAKGAYAAATADGRKRLQEKMNAGFRKLGPFSSSDYDKYVRLRDRVVTDFLQLKYPDRKVATDRFELLVDTFLRRDGIDPAAASLSQRLAVMERFIARITPGK